jgi:hypothetical protein
MKSGGVNPGNNSEPYALAFEFVSPSLTIAKSGTNVVISWPLYPDGFAVESTSALVSNWSTNGMPSSTVTNNQNTILLSRNGTNQFFRLRTPNF